MEKLKNKKIILLAVGIIVVLSIFIGITYAYFSRQNSTTTRTVDAGEVKIEYADDNENTLVVDNVLPIYDEDIFTDANKIGFSVTNTGDVKEYIVISMSEIVLPTELKNKNFKWALYSSDTKLSDGNFANVNSTSVIVKDAEQLNVGETKNYQLYIWVSESYEIQNDMMNKRFETKVKVLGSHKKIQRLASKIIEDNSPVTTTQPNFNNIATTDEGLIREVDADGYTYYFRGAVEDNYVYVPGYSYEDSGGYKNLFRIVRINGGRTTRIILDGDIGTSSFNTNSNDEKYVGYTYDNGKTCNIDENCDTTTGTSSTIKTKLESWYDNNMSEADKYIALEKFCNDTGVSSTSTTVKDEVTYNDIYYKANGRNYSAKTPSFICSTTTKEYGGLYNLKVGLLSMDEAAFAGGKNLKNNSYYLYRRYSYWLMSPSYFNTGISYEFYVGGGGNCDFTYNINNVSLHIIPVLNLKSEVLYLDGDGTKTSPYRITLN